jgi:hypothetical protein
MNRTTHRRNWWDNIREHLPASIAELPLLTAGEQTKLTWARPIEALAETPPIYAEALAALSARLGCFPRCILTPSYAGFLTRTTEKLVCCYGDQIQIFERAGDELHSTIYPQSAIDLMEFGSILLKAWLKIVGTDNNGCHTTTTVKFNSVTDYLLLPILQSWRSRQQPPGAAVLGDEQAKFDHLSREHYKFMNMARRLLLPGDRVLAFIMQPEMRTPLAALFGRTYTRLQAPAHIVVLTDRELIIAAEESRRGWRDDSKYGSISTYIPLPKITGVALQRTPAGDLQVVIDLLGDEQLQLDFAAAHAAKVDHLLTLLPDCQGQPAGG